mgnify:CR=1 FL=1
MKNNFDLSYKIDPSYKCTKYVKSFDEGSFTKHKYDDHILRANFCPSLISIIFNTNNIKTSLLCIKKFVEKAKDPKKIQFCIKVDNKGSFTNEFLDELKNIKCNFVILSSPQGRGYIDLWQWINYLYKVSSKRSCFIMNISDEMFVNEKNWDIALEKYINLEKDNIFRLRTSVYKNRNYKTLFECGYAPDTTAIYSRKYLSIQGDFSPCFGPDNGQQFVAYYLSIINYPRHYQFLRDHVINIISFTGQGTNKGLKGEARNTRMTINYLLWRNMFKHKFQSDYYKRARKIQLECLVESFDKIKVTEDLNKKRYELIFKDENEKNIKIYLPYSLSRVKVFLYNLLKINFFKYHTGYQRPLYEGIFTHIYIILFKKFPKQKINKIEPDHLLKNINAYIEKTKIIADNFYSTIPVLKKTYILEFIFFYIGMLFFGFIIILLLYKLKRILISLNSRFKIIKTKYYYKKKSHIFVNNKLDQSKSVILKGK